MKTTFVTISAIFLLLGLVAAEPVPAQELPWLGSGTNVSLFSAAELDDLLAPIALYPDPLLAQILPAATFVDQIDEAARYVRSYGVTEEIDDQGWDVSVKAVAHYPEVLFMMDRRIEWTTTLGQAFINQQAEVMNAIQRLRAEAMAQGNLVSTPQQQVIVDGGIIRIVPAAPDVIYVPVYDSQLVYYEPPPPASLLVFFGTGFIIGAWLNRDCDWHRHRIYYHGWQGGGWVGRARPHLHLRDNIYLAPRERGIHLDRKVMRRDTLRYRQEIRNSTHIRSERFERYRQPPSVPIQKHVIPSQPTRPAPQMPDRSQSERKVYRGRDIHRTQPESQSGYGGYGSREDAQRYQERGRSSQENMRKFNRSVPQPRPARPGVSEKRSSPPKPAVRSTPRQSPQNKIKQDEGGLQRQH